MKSWAGIVGPFTLALGLGNCSSLPDPVGHAVDVNQKPWSTELAPDIKVVAVSVVPNHEKTQLVSRHQNTAFVLINPHPSDSDLQCQTVYFTHGSHTYRIENVPLEYRPISDLVWASDQYLVFDRWSQPHYGIHYIVDTQNLRVVHVTPFPDEFYLHSK